MAPPAQLRGTRRDLALAFSGKSRTLYEASKALARPPGSIHGVVQRMVADGLLEPDTDLPTRGTLYSLTDTARRALDVALERDQPPGMLTQGQRLLVVRGRTDLGPVSRVLADAQLSGCLSWASETGTSHGYVLAIAPDASSFDVQKLQAALERVGCRCTQHRLGEIFSAGDLRRRAVSVAEISEAAT